MNNLIEAIINSNIEFKNYIEEIRLKEIKNKEVKSYKYEEKTEIKNIFNINKEIEKIDFYLTNYNYDSYSFSNHNENIVCDLITKEKINIIFYLPIKKEELDFKIDIINKQKQKKLELIFWDINSQFLIKMNENQEEYTYEISQKNFKYYKKEVDIKYYDNRIIFNFIRDNISQVENQKDMNDFLNINLDINITNNYIYTKLIEEMIYLKNMINKVNINMSIGNGNIIKKDFRIK